MRVEAFSAEEEEEEEEGTEPTVTTWWKTERRSRRTGSVRFAAVTTCSWSVSRIDRTTAVGERGVCVVLVVAVVVVVAMCACAEKTQEDERFLWQPTT